MYTKTVSDTFWRDFTWRHYSINMPHTSNLPFSLSHFSPSACIWHPYVATVVQHELMWQNNSWPSAERKVCVYKNGVERRQENVSVCRAGLKRCMEGNRLFFMDIRSSSSRCRPWLDRQSIFISSHIFFLFPTSLTTTQRPIYNHDTVPHSANIFSPTQSSTQSLPLKTRLTLSLHL